MKSFLKEFLRDEPAADAGSPRVCLGAFGKHPGWDDHMDDLGLETESLLLARHLLYVQGIGGQLNSGAWERLDEAARLPAIHHEFIWSRCSQVLAGRMWPSSDGKRRTLYPMAVCAHVFGLTSEACITSLLPLLEPVETRCRHSRTADEVRSIVLEALGQCMATVSSATIADLSRLSGTLTEQFIDGSLPVILGEVRRTLAPYLRGEFRERAKPAAGIRVPCPPELGFHDFVFWIRFFGALLDADAPVLFLKPVGQAWIDVIAGEPASGDLFPLRAGPAVVPVIGDAVPGVDERLRQEARALCESVLTPGRAAAPAEKPWLKKLFG
jgi:hypothetical protein